MAKRKYEALADSVVTLIGGKENIEFFTHCVTRLRFNVKDKSLVNKDEIDKVEGVLGSQWSGEQYQVIIGQSVGDAYQLICEKTGLSKQEAIDENLDEKPKGKFSITALFDAMAGCMAPLTHILIGAGFIKIIAMLLQMGGILSTDSSTYLILSFVGDAGFYFLPIFIGATAAKKFGANMGLGMLIGAMFIHPNFMAAVSSGTPLDFIGIPVYPTSYASTIFPVLISVWVMAPIEKFFAKISPDVVRSITEPLLTLLVMIPLALCVLGPAGAFLGTYVSKVIIWLYNVTGFLGVATFAALCPLLVITGMHGALMPYMMQSFSSLGWEPIVLTGMVISNLNQGAASAAVAFKSKKTDVKSVASGCAATAILGGVTEPAMFGVSFKYKTPLYGAMIGSFVGACVAGFGKAVAYALTGSAGIFALPVYLPGGMSNLLWMVAGCVIGVVVTFVVTYILYKDED